MRWFGSWPAGRPRALRAAPPHRYGAVLINPRPRERIAVLPGREAATLEAWLHNTPRREEGALYEALGITIPYGNATMTATRQVEALDSVSP
jgi:hypothetical protein